MCKWFKKTPVLPPFEVAKTRSPWMETAYRELGVAEIPGRQHNERIIEYGRHITMEYTEDEIPWCSAFVNYCLSFYTSDVTRSGLARSWLKFGQPISLDNAFEGCVVVFKRGNSGWQGHVGFYISHSKKHITIIGGNQGDKVSIKKYPVSKLLGIRVPNNV